MTMPNELDLITFEEGAEMLGEGIATFRKKVDDGKMPFVQISDKIRKVRKQDVVDFVNNQVVKPKDEQISDPIAKVEGQIELRKKEQELEALNAGFKNSEEFKQEFENLKEDREVLNQNKAKYELDKKTFDDFKAKSESEIAQGKANNVSVMERLKVIEADYKKKWKLEDEKRLNENKLVIIHLDELAKTVYNMHSCYIGKIAKEKLAHDLEPVLNYYGAPPVFNKKGEYLSLTKRLSETSEITKTRNETTVEEESEIGGNVKKTYELCVEFYKWAVSVQGTYEFCTWLYKELKLMEVLLFDKTPAEITSSMNVLMGHFGAINREIIVLAGKFDQSNHPNKVSDSSGTEYILKVSEEIERLLGIVEIGEE